MDFYTREIAPTVDIPLDMKQLKPYSSYFPTIHLLI
jgi:hypothetical protein